ncbi:MAG: SUMF1/EgtB/PvdO family nonheme iron enzyme [bacterium]
MKRNGCLIRPFIILSALVFCVLPVVDAVNIDVEMRLNDAGFVSFDHFKAELYLYNRGFMAPDASIFGILEIMGEYFFWPSFTTEVDFRVQGIEAGESTLLFLEFDFPDIDAFIPFGPMVFWGAWFVNMETWNYDFLYFWLGHEHKWTPTNTPTPTPTPTPMYPQGDLFSIEPIVGNMRFIAAGTYTQGSPDTEPCRKLNEGPQFMHVLTKDIVVMETEVSRQMWADLEAVQPWLPNDPSDTDISPTMDHPVQQITWYESVLFANLLSLQNGFSSCYYKDAAFTTVVNPTNYDIDDEFYCDFTADGYRLPTEGEWEYFSRAGTSDPFSCDESYYNFNRCGSCSPTDLQTLWRYCVCCMDNLGRTDSVGSKWPNPWNLKDVHGNVWEWCWDWYAVGYSMRTLNDYPGPSCGSYRALRGGAWLDEPRNCRSASRLFSYPSNTLNCQGFRLIRTVSAFQTPTQTPTGIPTPTPTPAPGDLVATDPIVGNMRFVPMGMFKQGSPDTEPCGFSFEGPQFTHILTNNIAVMETEVSRQMWANLKTARPELLDDPSFLSHSPTLSHPVQRSSWNQVVLFANLLSLENGFMQCYYKDTAFTRPVDETNYYLKTPTYCKFFADGYRLPTEGEWEYFARAGTSGPFSCDEPNYNSDNCDSCTEGTHPVLEQYCVYCSDNLDSLEVVASKLPNSWGLYDVHGNVWEWCWDKYAEYPTELVIDYAGPDFGLMRVCRGGSWCECAYFSRSAYRSWTAPTVKNVNLGFRLVRNVMP